MNVKVTVSPTLALTDDGLKAKTPGPPTVTLNWSAMVTWTMAAAAMRAVNLKNMILKGGS